MKKNSIYFFLPGYLKAQVQGLGFRVYPSWGRGVEGSKFSAGFRIAEVPRA